MRVLLTGAAGLVGHSAYDVLCESHEVTAFDVRPVAGVPEAIQGDVLDFAAVAAAMAGCEGVVNTIMAPNPTYAEGGPGFTVNVTGLLHLLEGARRAGVRRFVHTSSGAVHTGYPQGTRLTHDLYPLKASGAYSLSKVLQEELARNYWEQHGLSVACVRPWGIIDAQRMVDTEGRPVQGSGFGTIDRRDVATALAAALVAPDIGFECFYVMATQEGARRTDTEYTQKRLGWRAVRRFDG